MTLPPYISDILEQPEAVRRALSNFLPQKLEPVFQKIKNGEYQRIVLTGMGASHAACYPAYQMLTRLDLPVILVETSELLHYQPHTVNDRTLLWIVSQSGRSAEILELVNRLQSAPAATTLGITNDLSSPLGRYATPTFALYAGSEATVSAKTYVTTLALNLMAATQLTGGDLNQACGQLLAGVDAMQVYLQDYEDRVAEIVQKIGMPHSLMAIGRGPSLAAVRCSSFIVKEAAKVACEGMEAAQFRHGPLEMTGPDLTVLVFAGAAETARNNREIAMEIARYGGHALWISAQQDPGLPGLALPAVPELALPLVEILPLQMLTIALARQKSLEPGRFRFIGKVTEKE